MVYCNRGDGTSLRLQCGSVVTILSPSHFVFHLVRWFTPLPDESKSKRNALFFVLCSLFFVISSLSGANESQRDSYEPPS